MQLKYYGLSLLAHGILFGAVLFFLPVAQLRERPPVLISDVELVSSAGQQTMEEVPVTLPSAEETAAIAQEILSDAAAEDASQSSSGSSAAVSPAVRRSTAGGSPDARSQLAAGTAGAGPTTAAGSSGTGSAAAAGTDRGGEGKSGSGESSAVPASAGNGTALPVTVTNPSIAYAPEPEYPAEARRDHQEGRAVVSVLVGEDGSVESCSIEQSTGYASLDQAALAAVARWRFQPARRGEQAIEKWVLLPVSFSLY